MGKLIRVISLSLAAILVVIFLGTTFAITERTISYMNRNNFSFGDALRWSIEDYREWSNSIFGEKEDAIKYYDFTNKNVDVVACTAL